MATLEPTYEQLKLQRAQEWATAQAQAAQNLADVLDKIMKMPDVRDAPGPDSTYSHPDIFCPVDAGKYFSVPPNGWVTVNGVRHRAALICQSCGHKDTWDWATQQWMGG